MKVALEKGYIFPLKLKINKMVSNIPLVTRFNIFFKSVMCCDNHKSDLIMFPLPREQGTLNLGFRISNKGCG